MTCGYLAVPIQLNLKKDYYKMKIIYGNSKVATREKAACQQARVWLQYATILILMMAVGANEVKGQDYDYSGTYYIGSTGYVAGNSANNFYLCPTEGYIFYDAGNNTYTKTDTGKPFLTTETVKSKAGYDVSKALWIIEKHPSLNYYYIIHASDNQYLTYNDAFFSNTGRVRVHLEDYSSEKDEYVLFAIEYVSSTNSYDIISKYAEDHKTYLNGNTPRKYLNVNKGNKTGLVGDEDSFNNINTGGILGLWSDGSSKDPNGKFYLEDYIPRPTINYNGNDVVITYPTSATIYYTIDGSDPTDENNTNRLSFTGTTQSVSFNYVADMKAAAYIDGEYSNIAKNVCVHIGDNPYLLQSVVNPSFYMTAGNASGANTTVNTSSLPQAGMSWLFEDAGSVDGIQYYYIKNTSVNGYIRRDGNSFYITSTAPSNNNDYKFTIIPNYDNGTLVGYSLYNLGRKYYVYKHGSNNTDAAVNLIDDANNELARWNLITTANKSFSSPVTSSDNSSATYYTLKSVAAATQLITTPTGTLTYVTTSSDESDNQKWYFKDAGNDGWATYYYILNAMTGEAMYFDGTETESTQSNALIMKSLSELTTGEGGNENNYKFAIANTWGEGVYYIIPKPLSQFTKTKYAGVWYVNTSSGLQTQSNRASNNIKWQIEEVPNYVAPPYISYDVTTNTASLSCTTPGTTIYYTTDQTEATTSSTHRIPSDPSSFPLSAGIQAIRAIAAVGENLSNESSCEIPVQPTLTDAVADLRPYVIQSKEVPFYYMIPSVEVEGYQTVNTLNVPCKEMAWYFEYATTDAGVVYYYIRNTQGGYIYHSNDNVYINATKEETDAYKFKLVGSIADGFRITAKDATKPLYKVSIGTAAVSLANNTNNQSLWNLTPYTGRTSLPQWATAPFSESDDNATYYYTVNSVAQTTKPIILNNDGEIKSQTIPVGIDERKTMWVIRKVSADADDLLDYYTFLNAYTGELLYYKGGGRDCSTAVLQMGQPSGADATWSHFVIVQTVNGYNIIPRVIVDNKKAVSRNDNDEAFNCINRVNGSDIIGTYFDDGNNSRWTFEMVTTPVKCMTPVFTESEGNITVSCITNAADIYFTLEGSDPTADGVKYTNQIWPASSQHRIKAYAKLKNDNTDGSNSEVVILLNKPDIELAAGPYTYNGEAWEPAVTKVSVGESGSETTAPTSPATYTVSYSNNIRAGEETASVTLSDVADDLWYIWHGEKAFTIEPKELEITANSEEKVYDGTELTNENYTITDGTALATGDAITSITFTGSQTVVGESDNIPSAAVIENAGNEDVTDCYNITFINGTLTVTKRALTITADSETKEYDGTTLTKSSYTIEPELGTGDDITSITLTGSQTDVGESENVPSVAVIQNTDDEDVTSCYDITYVNGTLTITQKALNKDEIGTPANGITATITKDITDPDHVQYVVTVQQGESITLTAYNPDDPTADYDYTVSGEASISGYVATITAKKEGDEYTGNYTGFIKLIFADPKFWDDGAPYDPALAYDPDVATNHEFAAVYLSVSDMVPMANVKAHIVRKVNPTIGTVTISPVEYEEYIDDSTPSRKVNYIPDGVPVLLLSDNENSAGLNTLPKDETSSGISEAFVKSNQLKMAPANGVTVKEKEAYMFYRGEFVLTQAGTIKKDNFYIYNPNYSNAAGSSSSAPRRTLRFVIEDDDALGIDNRQQTTDNGPLNDTWFTLDGRSLSSKPAQKGLYIHGGKTVLVK